MSALIDIDAIERRALAAQVYTRSEWDEDECLYAADSDKPAEDTEQEFECPLCDGVGECYGQRYDGHGRAASTIVAYGIGDGLRDAEAFVEHASNDMLAMVAAVRRMSSELDAARKVLREVYESQPAACVGKGASLPCGACVWCRVRAALEEVKPCAPGGPETSVSRDRQRSIKPGRAVRAPFSIYVIVDAMGRIVSSAFAQPTYLELQAKSVRGERIVQYVLVGSGK